MSASVVGHWQLRQGKHRLSLVNIIVVKPQSEVVECLPGTSCFQFREMFENTQLVKETEPEKDKDATEKQGPLPLLEMRRLQVFLKRWISFTAFVLELLFFCGGHSLAGAASRREARRRHKGLSLISQFLDISKWATSRRPTCPSMLSGWLDAKYIFTSSWFCPRKFCKHVSFGKSGTRKRWPQCLISYNELEQTDGVFGDVTR